MRHLYRQCFFVPAFIFVIGTSASATRARRPGSSCRQCSDDIAMARSDSNLPNREKRKGSAPFKRRRKSKFVRRSNMRLSWAAETMLSICKCRYSRCVRVLFE